MRRAARVGLTVVIVVLCLSAQPIASAEPSTTSNSTNSEFQNATTLDGLVIEDDQVVLDSTITTITQDHGRVRYGPEVGDMDGSETFDTSNIDAVTDVEIEGRQLGGGTFILADVGVDSDVYTGPLEYPDTSFSTDNISTNTAVGDTTNISWTVSDNTNSDGEIADITLTGVEKPETATYTGAVHDAEDVQDATVTFAELTNAEAIITVEANDGTGWAEIASATTSNAGTKTLNISNSQADKHRISIDFSKDNAGGVTKVALTEEGVTFDGHIPSLSNPKPTDAVYNSPVTLSVDVTDVDFGRVQNDSLTVEFRDGSGETIGTDTLTSNGTINATYSDPVAGRNDWSVTVTDAYENTATAGPIAFRTPAELKIRDETTPGSLLTSANVTIELYVEGEEGQILQRETPNGVIDMSGLPADQPFIAVANAPGYEPRRIYVESILEQQTVYLIPSTADFVEPEFELQDFTGRFPSDETVLQVERPINGEWATIQGDRFGATGAYSVTLVRDQEHRLTLVNLRTGDEKSIGRFTPALDSAETIEVTESEAVVLVEGMPEIVINPSTRTLPALAGQSISGDITPGDAPLEEVSVEIRFDDGTSTETLATETHDSPDSVRFDETLNLSGYSDGQVVVEVGWIAQNGESASRTFEFSLREPISASRDTTFGLLPTLVTVPDRLAGDADPSTAASALTFASIFLTVIVTAVATVRMRLSTETAAAVALFSLSGFWVIGWLSGAIVFVATITGVALAGLRRGI